MAPAHSVAEYGKPGRLSTNAHQVAVFWDADIQVGAFTRTNPPFDVDRALSQDIE